MTATLTRWGSESTRSTKRSLSERPECSRTLVTSSDTTTQTSSSRVGGSSPCKTSKLRRAWLAEVGVALRVRTISTDAPWEWGLYGFGSVPYLPHGHAMNPRERRKGRPEHHLSEIL